MRSSEIPVMPPENGRRRMNIIQKHTRSRPPEPAMIPISPRVPNVSDNGRILRRLRSKHLQWTVRGLEDRERHAPFHSCTVNT
eukprot:5855163-Pyramimonas_sp.AAC.1